MSKHTEQTLISRAAHQTIHDHSDAAGLAYLLAVAADQLAQYQEHSDALRAIGRGLHISSPLSTDLVLNALQAEANRLLPRR